MVADWTRLPAGLLVAAGSVAGGLTRYLIATPMSPSLQAIPWAMAAVNIGGCAAIGLAAGLIHNAQWRFFLLAGVCGGFTSLSAFGLETLLLLEAAPLLALSYSAVTLCGGIAATALGAWLSSSQRRRYTT